MSTILRSSLIAKYVSQAKIDSYARDLDAWFDTYDVRSLIGIADHFAIKTENEATLHALVKEIAPYCVAQDMQTPGLSVRRMHDRYIATALLKEPLRIKETNVFCIELMQPQPKYEGKDLVGLDHLEYVLTDIDKVQSTLDDRGIQYRIDTRNTYKRVIWVKINALGERIKFTDKTLAEIVPLQIKDAPELVEVLVSSTSR